MGPHGSVWAYIKTGRSPMAYDHFWTPPDPKKGHGIIKNPRKRNHKQKNRPWPYSLAPAARAGPLTMKPVMFQQTSIRSGNYSWLFVHVPLDNREFVFFWNAIIVKSQHETAMQNAARAFMLVLSKSKCCVDICVAFPNACRVTCGAMSRIRPCRVSAPQIVEIIELSSIFRVLVDFCW